MRVHVRIPHGWRAPGRCGHRRRKAQVCCGKTPESKAAIQRHKQGMNGLAMPQLANDWILPQDAQHGAASPGAAGRVASGAQVAPDVYAAMTLSAGLPRAAVLHAPRLGLLSVIRSTPPGVRSTTCRYQCSVLESKQAPGHAWRDASSSMPCDTCLNA